MQEKQLPYTLNIESDIKFQRYQSGQIGYDKEIKGKQTSRSIFKIPKLILQNLSLFIEIGNKSLVQMKKSCSL